MTAMFSRLHAVVPPPHVPVWACFGFVFSSTALAGSQDVEVIQATSTTPHIVFAPRKTQDATVVVQFGVGSSDDEKLRGLTNVTQHAILGANPAISYERFALELYAASAKLTLRTGARESAFVLTSLPGDFERLAKRLIALTLSPELAARGLGESKRRAGQDRGERDAYHFATWLARATFPKPGLGNSPYARVEDLEAIRVQDIQAHAEKFFTPGNVLLVVSGAFEPDRFRTLVQNYNGGKRVRRERPQKLPAARRHYMQSGHELYLAAVPIRVDDVQSVAAAYLAAKFVQHTFLNDSACLGLKTSMVFAPVHREWLDFIMIAFPMPVGRGGRGLSTPERIAANLEEVLAIDDMDGRLEAAREELLEEFGRIDRDSRALAEALAMGQDGQRWHGPGVTKAVSTIGKGVFSDFLTKWLKPDSAIQAQLSRNPSKR